MKEVMELEKPQSESQIEGKERQGGVEENEKHRKEGELIFHEQLPANEQNIPNWHQISNEQIPICQSQTSDHSTDGQCILSQVSDTVSVNVLISLY
jgi:hypothetical protein